MIWILLLSVIANALLTLGVCWLLFRNGEVVHEAGLRMSGRRWLDVVTADQVRRWLNDNRDQVEVIDSSDQTSPLSFSQCEVTWDDEALLIEVAPDDAPERGNWS